MSSQLSYDEPNMEIDAFLADSVETVNGKIYALGAGWNVITTAALPAIHSRLGLGILIRVPYTATNQTHRLEISLMDSDGVQIPLADDPNNAGKKLMRFGTEFNVGRPPNLAPGEEQMLPMSMNIDRLRLPKAEKYNFVIEIDGAEVKRLPLRVAHQPTLKPI